MFGWVKLVAAGHFPFYLELFWLKKEDIFVCFGFEFDFDLMTAMAFLVDSTSLLGLPPLKLLFLVMTSALDTIFLFTLVETVTLNSSASDLLEFFSSSFLDL